ncbi:MAG TPA: SEC-C metal-binding domain-containing protein, partial [Pseudomonadales bacterium]|nr:SEC-C metal-binding domain-containing protein [Pseudomonadales bacterium]
SEIRARIESEVADAGEIVKQAGGLAIIGTERHEARRIDNQLRGRAGRQGDPGVSRFYLSMDDNLMRIFASDRVKSLMQRVGMQKGEAIEHRMVTNAIEKAQRKVEGRNFDIRKQLLEYDDVANDQRQMIYSQRKELMEAEDVADTVEALWDEVVNDVVDGYIPPQSLEEQWDVAGLEQALHTEFGVRLTVQKWLDEDHELHEEPLRERVVDEIKNDYKRKADIIGPEMRIFEKQIMLRILDSLWKEHLAAMDYLRQGIHLRAYAQKQPKQEYKREAFELFEELLRNVKSEVIRTLARVQIQSPEEVEAIERERRAEEARQKLMFSKQDAPSMDGSENGEGAQGDGSPKTPFVRRERKVGRNEPCPCGSGKKYKSCHGQL